MRLTCEFQKDLHFPRETNVWYLSIKKKTYQRPRACLTDLRRTVWWSREAEAACSIFTDPSFLLGFCPFSAEFRLQKSDHSEPEGASLKQRERQQKETLFSKSPKLLFCIMIIVLFLSTFWVWKIVLFLRTFWIWKIVLFLSTFWVWKIVLFLSTFYVWKIVNLGLGQKAERLNALEVEGSRWKALWSCLFSKILIFAMFISVRLLPVSTALHCTELHCTV
jgi:hypothetical protein